MRLIKAAKLLFWNPELIEKNLLQLIMFAVWTLLTKFGTNPFPGRVASFHAINRRWIDLKGLFSPVRLHNRTSWQTVMQNSLKYATLRGSLSRRPGGGIKIPKSQNVSTVLNITSELSQTASDIWRMPIKHCCATAPHEMWMWSLIVTRISSNLNEACRR